MAGHTLGGRNRVSVQRKSHAVRIALAAASLESDWHSSRLFEACAQLAEVKVVDPARLVVASLGGKIQLPGLQRFHAWLLARGLSQLGDGDLQVEAYRQLSSSGVPVANHVDSLLAAQDKLRTSCILARAGVPTPMAGAAQDEHGAWILLTKLGTSVLKPLCGSLGRGVCRVEPTAAGRRAVCELLEREGRVYLQALVPCKGKDLRAFVVGGRVVAAMERQAARGEFATNVALGAKVRPLALELPFEKVALAATRSLELDWAGVDLASLPSGAPTVLEVNGVPAFSGLLEATGIDPAPWIARHLLMLARHRMGESLLAHVKH